MKRREREQRIVRSARKVCVFAALFVTTAWCPAFAQENDGSQFAPLVQAFRSQEIEKEIFSRRIVSLLENDPESAAELKEELKPAELELVGEAILKKSEGALSGKSKRDLQFWSNLAETLLPQGDSARQKVNQYASFSKQLDEILEKGALSELDALRRAAAHHVPQAALDGFFSQRLQASAEKHLDEGDTFRALQELAAIPADTNSPALKQLSSRVVKGIAEKLSSADEDPTALLSAWPKENEQVSSFLRRVEEGDDEAKHTLTALFSRLTLAAVIAGDGDSADLAYSEVLRRRPDPNEANNELRRDILSHASSDDTRDFAKGRIHELERYNGLSVGTRLRLVYDGYYGSQYVATALKIIAGVIALFALAYVASTVIGLFRNRAPTGDEDEEGEDQEQKRPRRSVATRDESLGQSPGFKEKLPPSGRADEDGADDGGGLLDKVLPFQKKRTAGYMHLAEEPDEYGKLLDLFGLEDGASEEEIKSAFRQKAKELHPDRNAPDPEAEQLFRDYQKAYERILEIRKSWFSRP